MPKSHVICTFASSSEAEDAVTKMESHGFNSDNISIITKEDLDNEGSSYGFENTAETTGILLGYGSMAITNLGAGLAPGGPIAGLMSAVPSRNSLSGMLAGLGIPESKSTKYESQLHEGSTLFTIRIDDKHIRDAFSILNSCGASSVDAY